MVYIWPDILVVTSRWNIALLRMQSINGFEIDKNCSSVKFIRDQVVLCEISYEGISNVPTVEHRDAIKF